MAPKSQQEKDSFTKSFFSSGECCEFRCADSFSLQLTHNHQDTAGHRKCSKFLNQSEQMKKRVDEAGAHKQRISSFYILWKFQENQLSRSHIVGASAVATCCPFCDGKAAVVVV